MGFARCLSRMRWQARKQLHTAALHAKAARAQSLEQGLGLDRTPDFVNERLSGLSQPDRPEALTRKSDEEEQDLRHDQAENRQAKPLEAASKSKKATELSGRCTCPPRLKWPRGSPGLDPGNWRRRRLPPRCPAWCPVCRGCSLAHPCTQLCTCTCFGR